MGGVFGGLLGAGEWVGGMVLYVLVGQPAFRDTFDARLTRIIAGSLALGLATGLVLWMLGFSAAFPIFLPIGSLAVFLMLGSLEESLERGE